VTETDPPPAVRPEIRAMLRDDGQVVAELRGRSRTTDRVLSN
jgi:hypothetical protein